MQDRGMISTTQDLQFHHDLFFFNAAHVQILHSNPTFFQDCLCFTRKQEHVQDLPCMVMDTMKGESIIFPGWHYAEGIVLKCQDIYMECDLYITEAEVKGSKVSS